jgi:hypothetical protein
MGSRLTGRRYLQILLIWIAILILAFIFFHWRSRSLQVIGFPLDDAWIHQTYARNLAALGEWSFIPGEVSAGSTSPLWTLLLIPGQAVGLDPVWYSAFLGGVALLGVGGLIAALLLCFHDLKPVWFVGITSGVLLEWHLLWAALSGMETLLLGLHILIVLLGVQRKWDPGLLGVLVGLGLWIRPDALLGALPVALYVLSENGSVRSRLACALRSFIGFLLLAIPYLGINYLLGGEIWPSTFFAKQIEYGVTRELGLLQRFLTVASAPLVGPTALLLPGLVISIRERIRQRSWIPLGGILWLIFFILIYALRLPVTYQHGRYMMPLIPVLCFYGIDGVIIAINSYRHMPAGRVLVRAWGISLIILTLVFIGLGANAYARDVAVIETEMVVTAKWIQANTDENDLIAAHDIGALGYYADRDILDLAGLVSPEVIEILRDEPALAEFIDEQGADYLVTFPSWYPLLTADQVPIFSSQGEVSPAIGGENMAVYRWR